MYIQTISPEKVGREGVCLLDCYRTQGRPVNHNAYTEYTMGGVSKNILPTLYPKKTEVHCNYVLIVYCSTRM